jgi:hypothetical protein
MSEEMTRQVTREPSEQARAQENARDYLAYDGRLANPPGGGACPDC